MGVPLPGSPGRTARAPGDTAASLRSVEIADVLLVGLDEPDHPGDDLPHPPRAITDPRSRLQCRDNIVSERLLVRKGVGLHELRERLTVEALLVTDPLEGLFLLPGPVSLKCFLQLVGTASADQVGGHELLDEVLLAAQPGLRSEDVENGFRLALLGFLGVFVLVRGVCDRREKSEDARDCVPARAEREESTVAFGHQEDGVRDTKVSHHPVERRVGQFVEIATAGQVVDAGAHRREKRHAPAGRRRRWRFDLFHIDDAEDVGAEEPEDLFEPMVRGDPGKLGLHRLEERPGRPRLHIVKIEPVLRQRGRIEYLDTGLPGREQVSAGLVEELVGQRDMRLVHPVDLADHRGVGDPVGVAGAERGRRDALHRTAQRAQVGHAHLGSSAPAPGPGVWVNTRSGQNSSETRSVVPHCA